jgi:hypothetical protein
MKESTRISTVMAFFFQILEDLFLGACRFHLSILFKKLELQLCTVSVRLFRSLSALRHSPLGEWLFRSLARPRRAASGFPRSQALQQHGTKYCIVK